MTDQVTEQVDASSEQQQKETNPKAYDEVKADMLKYKQKLKGLEQENERLLEEKKTLETKNLQDQNQYKTLYEKITEENKILKKSLTEVKTGFIENEKLREIEMKALTSGLKPKALELLRNIASGTEDVVVEITNTGRTQVVGVESYIEKLKQQYADVLFVDGKAPNINTNVPNTQVTTKSWTGKELLELQRKDPAQYQKVMQEKISKRS